MKYKQDLEKNIRMSDKLLVLDYCVKESFKRKKTLYLISIDFQKAFDSIKRDTLIYALKNIQNIPFDIMIIDVIANIQKTKLNSTSIVYIKMISISPVALDSDAMTPVIYVYLLHI